MKNQKYSVEGLWFILSHVGMNIETLKDSDDINELDLIHKESTYSPGTFIHGITNGEFYFGFYDALTRLISGENPDHLNDANMAILSSVVSLSTHMFLDTVFIDGDEDLKAHDEFMLHALYQETKTKDILRLRDEEKLEKKNWREYDLGDWKLCIELIETRITAEPEYVGFNNFSQYDHMQPHLPNLQEYRKAMVWIDYQYHFINKHFEKFSQENRSKD